MHSPDASTPELAQNLIGTHSASRRALIEAASCRARLSDDRFLDMLSEGGVLLCFRVLSEMSGAAGARGMAKQSGALRLGRARLSGVDSATPAEHSSSA